MSSGNHRDWAQPKLGKSRKNEAEEAAGSRGSPRVLVDRGSPGGLVEGRNRRNRCAKEKCSEVGDSHL